MASRTLVRSIFQKDGGCFQALPARNLHHERTSKKFEIENDQGRFRAVVMGVVHISITSITPLGVIQSWNLVPRVFPFEIIIAIGREGNEVAGKDIPK